MSYTAKSLERALARAHVAGYTVLQALRNSPSPHAQAIAAQWRKLPLDRRIGHAAILIGRSFADRYERLITRAYLDLCRTGRLDLAPPRRPG